MRRPPVGPTRPGGRRRLPLSDGMMSSCSTICPTAPASAVFACFVLIFWPIIPYTGEEEVRCMSDGKKTMTLNLTEREMEVLEELSRKKELSKTAVIRQALRLFQ